MKKIFLASLLVGLFFMSCSNSDDGNPQQPDPTVTLNDEVNDFVWKAMNYWYFWQSDVSDLADTKNDVQDDYYTYLNGFSSSEDLFDSLLFSADDFSWYIPDVDEQLNSFRGISESYGIRLPSHIVRENPSSNNIVIYVGYVVPDSPADNAGIVRGDLIYKVNGTVLNTSNASLINKIFSDPTIDLGIGRIENGTVVHKSDESLTAVLISENPVHYSSIIEEGGKKIGYLVYNGFRSTFHAELNDVFADFKNQGIDELILDLRYNGGGSVLTSAYLSSMIEGDKADGSLFASLTYNQKRNPDNGVAYPFFDQAAIFDKQTGDFTNSFIPINRLTNLNRLYVLTSRRTASASEMIINGLRPSMPVITVGTVTVGKNEGSITLVDAPGNAEDEPYTNLDGRSSNHTIGMQPIVFQIFNSLNQSDYADGFPANVEIDELDHFDNILPFGDTNEVQLRVAINHINGVATKSLIESGNKVQLLDGINHGKFSNEMYILPGEKNFTR